ncbi:hypothetical protein Efla_006869 [Eimeria flavescens]
MPPSAGRLRLLQRAAFTCNISRGSGPQSRVSRRLLRKDPGLRAASHTRTANLEALPHHAYHLHVKDFTQQEKVRRAIDGEADSAAARSRGSRRQQLHNSSSSSRSSSKSSSSRSTQQQLHLLHFSTDREALSGRPLSRLAGGPSASTAAAAAAAEGGAVVCSARGRDSRTSDTAVYRHRGSEAAAAPAPATAPAGGGCGGEPSLQHVLKDPYVLLCLRGAAARSR